MHLAPQNEHQHLSFVKDIHVVGTKWSENFAKLPNAKNVTFESEQTIPGIYDLMEGAADWNWLAEYICVRSNLAIA
jgi:hypothetical protein